MELSPTLQLPHGVTAPPGAGLLAQLSPTLPLPHGVTAPPGAGLLAQLSPTLPLPHGAPGASLLEVLRGLHGAPAAGAAAGVATPGVTFSVGVSPAPPAGGATAASAAATGKKFARRTHPRSLGDLVSSGVLTPGPGLMSVRGAEHVTADLTADGKIVTAEGAVFTKPSGFATSVLKSARDDFKKGNGWALVLYKEAAPAPSAAGAAADGGEAAEPAVVETWRPLLELRGPMPASGADGDAPADASEDALRAAKKRRSTAVRRRQREKADGLPARCFMESGYTIYLQENTGRVRAALRAQSSALSPGAVLKELAREWVALGAEDKAAYNAKVPAARARWAAATAALGADAPAAASLAPAAGARPAGDTEATEDERDAEATDAEIDFEEGRNALLELEAAPADDVARATAGFAPRAAAPVAPADAAPADAAPAAVPMDSA